MLTGVVELSEIFELNLKFLNGNSTKLRIEQQISLAKIFTTQRV